ncbi:hypothetical protein QE152_g14401 [Popillia japonica]|uniref:Uncharacterized protein n=1 Tax=Popillia japonica TaxID=7064 RepID=A0AAW1L9G4_POPJA
MTSVLWCFNVSCPLVHRKIRNFGKLGREWINDHVIASSNELRDLFWLKSRLNSDALNTLYNEKKKLHNKLIVDVKSNYYRAKLNNSSNKTKTLWKVVNDKRKPTHVNNAQKININKNGILIDEPGVNLEAIFRRWREHLWILSLSAVDSSPSAVICDPCPSFLFQPSAVMTL